MKAQGIMAVKVLALVGAFGLVVANARAEDKKADATGTWKWVRKGQDGQEQETTATLKQDGDKLTGKIASQLGEIDIKNGTVKDGKFATVRTYYHFRKA